MSFGPALTSTRRFVSLPKSPRKLSLTAEDIEADLVVMGTRGHLGDGNSARVGSHAPPNWKSVEISVSGPKLCLIGQAPAAFSSAVCWPSSKR